MSNSNSPHTPVSLLNRLRDHPSDQAAWAAFVGRYGPMIFSWARRWGLQEADAADITQGVLTAMTTKLPTFEYNAAGSFRAWLKTITQRASRDLLQRQARELTLGHAGPEAPEVESDLWAGLEEASERELLELAMDRVRAQVQPRTWEAFRLTALDGLPGPSAAEQLSMTVAAVHKARSNVQKRLEAEVRYLEGEPP